MPASQAVADWPTIIAFDILAATSTLFGLLVFLTVHLSSRLYRRPTWYATLVSCCIYSGAFLLPIGWQHISDPPYHLCAFQAILLHSLPPYCTVALACFVIDFYLTLKELIFSSRGTHASRMRVTILLAAPAVVFLITLLVDVLTLVHDPKAPEWQLRLYCHLGPPLPISLSAAVGLLCFLVLFVIVVRIGLLLWRHYSGLKMHPTSLHREAISLYIRIAVFSFTVALGITLGIISFMHPNIMVVLAAFAYLILPTTVFIALGTQRDIMERWICWRSAPSRSVTASWVLNGRDEPHSLQ